MKVLGKNGSSVIVELEQHEWVAIGGKTHRPGRWEEPDVSVPPPKLFNLVKFFDKIGNACPDLKNIRAAFQAFLLLTEPSVVQETLDKCRVGEYVVAPGVTESKPDGDDDDDEA